MAHIKKLKENELIGGTDNSDVYPVTHTKAIYDGNNKVLDTRLNENDSDRELLHRQSEKLVPSIVTTPVDGTTLEIGNSLNSIHSVCSASVETFGDEPMVTIPVSNYQEASLTLNGTPISITGTDNTTVTSDFELGRSIGVFQFDFTVKYNGITKRASSKIYQNLRKYFGFASSTPTDVTTLGVSHFSNSVGCTVTIPANGTGFKPIYLCVPNTMSITRVTQPDALNAPLPIIQVGTVNRVIDGTTFTYNVYKSVDTIDSSVSKRLTIS